MSRQSLIGRLDGECYLKEFLLAKNDYPILLTKLMCMSQGGYLEIMHFHKTGKARGKGKLSFVFRIRTVVCETHF